ncbi:MAG: hypothetical protein ACI8TQ_000946 [Planctomycetota bacterium]|jgi:hypothetical protein
MKSIRILPIITACLWLATCSCESNAHDRDSGPMPLHSVSSASREGPPVVAGVTIHAATGQPLANVTLTLPDGTTAVSDASGRFEMVGMLPGLEGLLEASHEDGLLGSNRLLPLAGGRLEVVVRLRRPRAER